MSILNSVVAALSGQPTGASQQLLFDKVIGFKSAAHGAGATTIVYNIAAALADATKYNICVLDTHMLYPTLNAYIVGTDLPLKDWFDYSGRLSDIIVDTKFKNVKYIGFYKRTFADMLSTRDCKATVDGLINMLKNVFDVILVDLSDELTVVNAYTSIYCNKIYTVVTPEIASIQGFPTTINTTVSQAVPAYKLRNCIINKAVNGNAGNTLQKLLDDYGYKVVAQIPYSTEVFTYGLQGELIWGATTRNNSVTYINKEIEKLLIDICEITDKNQTNITDEKLLSASNIVQTPKVSKIMQSNDMHEKQLFEQSRQQIEQNSNKVVRSAGARTPIKRPVSNHKQVK